MFRRHATSPELGGADVRVASQVPLRTLNEMWVHACDAFATQNAVYLRQSRSVRNAEGKITEEVAYFPLTYSDLDFRVQTFGRGLIEVGLMEHEAVGLISENSLRWLVCDLAVLGNRAFDVPRGVSFPAEEILYILQHSEAKIVVVETEKELDQVCSLRAELPKMESIIVLDKAFTKSNRAERIYTFDDIIELGFESPPETQEIFLRRRQVTMPDDVATVMYTSGTTGTPKGIPLTHNNIMHNVKTIPSLLHMHAGDKFLSLLPVWHILERTSEYLALRAGASIWYTTRLTFARDLGTVSPTHVVSVPRIWVLLYDGVMASLRQKGKSALFAKLYAHSLKVVAARRYRQRRQYLLIGEEPVKKTASVRDHILHRVADLLIYRKIRGRLGTAFAAGISGGGALPEYIDDFFEALGVTLLEGYGLTETSPVLCVRTFEHRIPYTVGRPLPETEIKILDEEEKPVTGSEQGVVWVSGPQVMEGYRKNPEETAKVMRRDDDGRLWFNTGDLGRRTRDGDISIVGRVKDTIVLLGGENVEPARIESAMTLSELVDQVMVCGQDQEFLTALVVPNTDKLKEICESEGIDFDARTLPELLKHEAVHKVYMDDICSRVAESTGFREVELIHDLAFVRPFVPDDGTLTQTLKVKRRKVQARDSQSIKAMYPRYREAGHIKGGGS